MKVNRLKNKTINNLIQIKHSEKVAPSLESVSFSAALKNGGITIEQGDKVMLKIVDKNGDAIKYYTDADRILGTVFPDAGKEFTFNANGSLDGGFYLEASTDAYSITKFDITTKTAKYELKDKVSLTITTGQAASATVALVEKKGGAVTGVDDKGTAVGFKVSDATNPLEIKVKFQKSDDTFFNSTNDKDVIIQFDVKDGTNEVYGIPSLFGIGLPAKANLFTITLPREKDYYTNALKLTATAKHGKGSHKFADLNIANLTAVDTLKTKVINANPVITNNGADGTSGYSDHNKTFDVRKNKTIQVFTVEDQDNDKLTTTYKWELWKKSTSGVNDTKVKDIGKSKSAKQGKDGKINPSLIGIPQGYAKPEKTITSISSSDLQNYYIKVTVKTDDGLGGKDRQKYIRFYFTK